MRDLISREAAIAAITEIDEGCNMDIYTNEVKDILRELPSAELTDEEVTEYCIKRCLVPVTFDLFYKMLEGLR